MAHTHEHDCAACGAHFDSSNDLERHNREHHLRTATGTEKPRLSAARTEKEGDQRSNGLN